MGKNKDALMVQVVLAFAQGCGGVEVSEEACTWFHNRYYQWIDKPKTNKDADGRKPMDVWDESKKGFFGNFKEIGKRAAEASSGGTIQPKTLEDHALAVERENDCPWCPDRE